MSDTTQKRSARRARLMAGVLAVGIAVPSLQSLGVATWPFTSWELFSRIREPNGVTWRVAAVDTTGDEHLIDLGAAGPGLEGWFHVAKTIDRLPANERAEVCAAWLEAAVELRPATRALVVYRYRTSFVPRGDRVERVLEEPTEVATCS